MADVTMAEGGTRKRTREEAEITDEPVGTDFERRLAEAQAGLGPRGVINEPAGIVPAARPRTEADRAEARSRMAQKQFRDPEMRKMYEEVAGSGGAKSANPYPKMSAQWRKFNLAKARYARKTGTGKKKRTYKGVSTTRGRKSVVSREVHSHTGKSKKTKQPVTMRIGKKAKDQLAGISQDRFLVQQAALVAVKSAIAAGRVTVVKRDVDVAAACLHSR